MSSERRRQQARSYYWRHRESIRREARERYANDPDYRANQRAQEAKFRERVRMGYNPRVYPLYDDSGRRVFRQSEASRMACCEAASIIKWIRDGWIPEPERHRGRKVFRQHQVQLLALFAAIKPKGFDRRSIVSKYIFERW